MFEKLTEEENAMVSKSIKAVIGYMTKHKIGSPVELQGMDEFLKGLFSKEGFLRLPTEKQQESYSLPCRKAVELLVSILHKKLLESAMYGWVKQDVSEAADIRKLEEEELARLLGKEPSELDKRVDKFKVTTLANWAEAVEGRSERLSGGWAAEVSAPREEAAVRKGEGRF